MAKDGVLLPGPQAWATLIIFGFIKLINQPGETLRARTERMHMLWCMIREYPDVKTSKWQTIQTAEKIKILNTDDGEQIGDPRVHIIDRAWSEFRGEYDARVDSDPNWQDKESELAASLDQIMYLMTGVVVDNKIMERAKYNGPIDLEVEK